MPENKQPFIKPGMNVRILNERGIGGDTRFFNPETGEELFKGRVAYPVKIDISDNGPVKVELLLRRVPVDLIGTVVGMKITEDAYFIEVNPEEFDVVVWETSQDGLKRVYFERKK
jgi:hypothetical protein